MVQEPTTTALQALYGSDSFMIVWWGSEVEVGSAIARLERQATLSSAGVGDALRRLDDLKAHWRELAPSYEIRALTRRLLRLYPLRAADSLQLASALRARDAAEIDLEFVCLDERLSQAARGEGLIVIDEIALLGGPSPLAQSSGEPSESSESAVATLSDPDATA